MCEFRLSKRTGMCVCVLSYTVTESFSIHFLNFAVCIAPLVQEGSKKENMLGVFESFSSLLTSLGTLSRTGKAGWERGNSQPSALVSFFLGRTFRISEAASVRVKLRWSVTTVYFPVSGAATESAKFRARCLSFPRLPLPLSLRLLIVLLRFI